jgi:hypothetical protein
LPPNVAVHVPPVIVPPILPPVIPVPPPVIPVRAEPPHAEGTVECFACTLVNASTLDDCAACGTPLHGLVSRADVINELARDGARGAPIGGAARDGARGVPAGGAARAVGAAAAASLTGALPGHWGRVLAVCVLRNGSIVSSSADSCKLFVWDKNGEVQMFKRGHGHPVTTLCALDDTVVAASEHIPRVWEPSTGRELCRLKHGGVHAAHVVALCALGRGRCVSGSLDRTLRLWLSATGECTAVLSGHAAAVRGVCALGDARVVSASDDRTLRVWDVDTAACVGILTGHTGPVLDACMLGDERVVSASADGTLRVWCAAAVIGEAATPPRVWGPVQGREVEMRLDSSVTGVCTVGGGRVMATLANGSLQLCYVSKEPAAIIREFRGPAAVAGVAELDDGRVVVAGLNNEECLFVLSKP